MFLLASIMVAQSARLRVSLSCTVTTKMSPGAKASYTRFPCGRFRNQMPEPDTFSSANTPPDSMPDSARNRFSVAT